MQDHLSRSPLVELREATVVRAEQAILDGVSWAIRPGEHWVILGPNGAGKTTIARVVSGSDHLDRGEIDILGFPAGEHNPVDLAGRVGLSSIDVWQRLLSAEKVIDVVVCAAWGQTIRFDEDYDDADLGRAQDLLDVLGIGALGNRPISTLSEGERRRVLLARALMTDPEVLILDEPTAGLDLGGRETLVTALKEIMGNVNSPAVVLTTHELEAIGKYFTHALILCQGRVVASGPIFDVLTDQNLSDAFGLDLRVSRRDGRWQAVAVH